MSHSSVLRTDAPLAASGAAGAAGVTAPALLAVFMATLVVPVSVEVAGLRLTPIRLVLLLSFVPLLARILSGGAGRLTAVDLFMGLFAIQFAVSLLVTDGMDRFDFVGISMVELVGGYLVGRCFIRNAADFRLLWKLHLITLLFLFPFAVVESLTGRILWHEILDAVGEVTYRADSSRPRMGLDRVLSGFEHPILYGLYCSLGGAVGFYVLRDKLMLAFTRLGFVTCMTFLSLSSGALLSVMIQAQIMVWDWIMKGRWKLLIALAASLYVFLEIASNRGAILIFVETFTFSSGTAWTRIHQWTYGTAEVMRHPFFGIGLTGDWERPSWLVSSVDNYWLVVAMRHGLPGVIFLLAAVVFLVRRTVRARDLSPLARRYRTGYLITLVGMCFTLATVHIWGAISVFAMFYIGAGVWIADAAGTESEGEAKAPTAPGRGAQARDCRRHPGGLPLRRSFAATEPEHRPAASDHRTPSTLRRDRVPARWRRSR